MKVNVLSYKYFKSGIAWIILIVGILFYYIAYFQLEQQSVWKEYNPQIQISAESGTKRSIFRQKNKTKRSKKRLRTTLIKSEQKVNETSVPALYFRKNTFRMAF